MSLIQYGSSGVLAATGVIVGQRVLARREDNRWVRESQRELQRWEREDRHRWAAERQRVFTEYLGMASAWRAYIRHLRYSPDMPYEETPASRTLTHDAERLIAEMELLGSGKVAVAARALWMWIGASAACLPEQGRPEKNKDGFVRQLDDAYQDLLVIRRDDLGLESPLADVHSPAGALQPLSHHSP